MTAKKRQGSKRTPRSKLIGTAENPPPGFKLLHTLGGVELPNSTMAWSPDGRTLAAALSDGKVFLWDAQKAETISLHDAHSGPVNCIAWSPDGAT